MFVNDGSGSGDATDFLQSGDEPLLVTINMPRHVSLISADFTPSGVTACGFNSRGLPFSDTTVTVELKNNKQRRYEVELTTAGNITIERIE